MTEKHEELWRSFPKTLMEFEKRFSDEAACRSYLEQLRWGGQPSCSRCEQTRMYALHNGRYQCKTCGYQLSVTAGTVFHRSQKPLRLWFRAIWEMMTRKNGLSAKDLQRLLGFSSYETAWRWLHKLRATLDPRNSSPLSEAVQLDEGFVGRAEKVGNTTRPQNTVLVAAEQGGRIRMAQGPDCTKATVERFVETVLDEKARITTDKHGSHHPKILKDRLKRTVLSETSKQGDDPLQHCHWAISLLKRWWLGTHHGAIEKRYTQAYLDEFSFRYNRRKTHGVGRLVARVLERAVSSPPIFQGTLRVRPVCPWFSQASLGTEPIG